jgi:hypothetical protein
MEQNTTEAPKTPQGGEAETTERPDRLLHGAARTEAIQGMRALLDLLEADPELPLDEYAFHINVSPRDAGVDVNDNADAVCWLGIVAGALGVEVTDHVNRIPSEGTDVYKARRRFGDYVEYESTHITPEYRAARRAATEGGAL